MVFHVLLQLLLLTTALATSIGKPGCTDRCGHVAIPYPFGIGDDPNCVVEGLQINCNTSFNPPRPFLGNFEVLEICLEGQIRIAGLMVWDCYSELGPRRNESQFNSTWIRNGSGKKFTSLEGSFYTFSDTRNSFTAIGCDTIAYIGGGDNTTDFSTGCASICPSEESLNNGSCKGVGCCQAAVPKGRKFFEFSLQSLSERTESFSLCSYAFIVEKAHFEFSTPLLSVQNFTDEVTKKYPMVLDWAVGKETCEQARRNPFSYNCGLKSNCINSDSGGFNCDCPPGFKGNAYLPGDCQDVNDCVPNPCKRGDCENKKDGSGYICSCPKGKHGDYGIDGDGCIANVFPTIQVVIGVCVSLLFLLVSSSWLYWGIKKRRLIKLKEKFFQQNGGMLLQQRISTNENVTETAKIFTEEELRRATDNYDQSRIIGRGGSGTVYKGILSDHRIVAIKKSRVADGIQINQFINEISILLQINHRNVVKLLGCCLETQVPLLVYEFVSNETLSHHVHDEGYISSISWENRLRIAAEAASALAYLHSAASFPIIHRDVKSTNILLDENYTAKVSDFGASKLVPLDYTQITTLVQGTLGYLDPEYFQTSQLTEKSDVYSFGVVLLELLTGEKPVSTKRSEEGINLSMYFISSMKENRLFQILEKRIVDEGGREQLYAVANIAERCLRMRGAERPTMREVVAELDQLRRPDVHPWVALNLEESKYLLDEPSGRYNSSQGDAKDSLKGQNILLESDIGW
ncbi:wall-associated receptor kinase 2-like [Tasmannia lanceolata]|uniref:wall-associated receptor kinase 2-like n=1 Tax=Tasmannia lanceolata TaxID=3420 RepID=UPI004062B7B3